MFLLLYAVLFLGEAGVVDLEVLIWFLLCAFSIESVLLTLRHGFDPFLGDLFSVEPVLVVLRYKILSYSALLLVGSMWLTLRHRCCDVFFMVKPILLAWRHDLDPFG